MKRIIFVINNFRIGGIQKSLVELLKQISNNYDISVYCSNFDGPLTKELPENVRLIKGNRWAKLAECGVKESIRYGFVFFILKFLLSFWSRCFNKKLPAKLYVKLLNQPQERYNIAVSYSQPLPPNDFSNLSNEIVLLGVKADRKYSFLHCDYGEYGGRSSYSESLYERFDGVVAVSNSVARRFTEILPGMKHKVCVVLNACDIEGIKKAAEEFSIIYGKPSMVSVSRLSVEKGLERCLPVVKNLVENGLVFEWHIVGDGSLKKQIADYIIQNGLTDVVFLEGAKTNPYPYIKAADYLFLPSFHEAAPMVFNEASCLGTPVLTTKTLSAVELIENRQMGFVCENNAEAIERMLVSALTSVNKCNYKSLPDDYNLIVKEQFNKLCSES